MNHVLKPSFSGLRVRLAALVMLSVVPAFALVVYLTSHERQQATGEAGEEALTLVELIAAEQSRLISGTQMLLASFGRVPEARSGDTVACSGLFADLVTRQQLYDNIGVIDPDGTFFCSAKPTPQPVNVADLPWFVAARDTGQLAVGNYMFSRFTGQPVLPLMYPILDENGNTAHVVSAALAVNWVQEAIDRLEMPPDTTITLIDPQGLVLFRYPDSTGWLGKSALNEPIVQTVLERKVEGATDTVGMDKKQRLFAFAPLVGPQGATTAYVLVGIPRSLAFAAANRELLIGVASLSAATLLVVLIAWLLGHYLLIKPVSGLTSAAKRLSDGDAAARSGMSHARRDEIGLLARSFDYMADAIERRDAEQTRLSNELKRMASALYSSSWQFSGSLDEKQIASELCRMCVELGGAKLTWVGLAEAGGAVRIVTQFPLDVELVTHVEVRWDDSALGQGPTGRAIRTGRAVVTPDLPDDPRTLPWREYAKRHGLRCSAAFPLTSLGDTFGVLTVNSDQRGFFDPQRMEFFHTIAQQAAAAISNARLFQQAKGHSVELEERVARRTAELNDANQELQQFVYSVSHDLRAPLRAMEGFSQALLEDYAGCLDAVGQDYAKRIAAASHRLDALIQDLLAYSRVSRAELRLESVDLGMVVQDVLGQFEAEITEKNAKVTLEPPFPKVKGHHAMLVQAISNLVSNALKFMAQDIPPRIRIRCEERDGFVRLWVEDNGIGIAPEHQQRLFRLFERLHGIDKYQGTGIGLAIVRRGAERMGGRVGVESTLGRGSRFWIDLRKAEVRP